VNSWWELGEGSGYRGSSIDVDRITCPFCSERGNFDTAFHAEKRKPDSSKLLNFDTLECANCRGYVMVLWSADERSFDPLYNFHVLPWPLKLDTHPDEWPTDVGRYWLQAQRNVADENWDAAVVMARSALQLALRCHGASGDNLKKEIADLADKGVLPPLMREWSDEVRELGNDSAHPSPSENPVAPEDARDIVRFLDFLLEYLYTLPHQIGQYRLRRSPEGTQPS
jgi:hypothetical protein